MHLKSVGMRTDVKRTAPNDPQQRTEARTLQLRGVAPGGAANYAVLLPLSFAHGPAHDAVLDPYQAEAIGDNDHQCPGSKDGNGQDDARTEYPAAEAGGTRCHQ